MKVYPNPFSTQFTLDYALTISSETTIYLTNIFGQKVSVLKNNNYQEKGNYQLVLATSNLTEGIYFVVMESGGGRTIMKQVVRL